MKIHCQNNATTPPNQSESSFGWTFTKDAQSEGELKQVVSSEINEHPHLNTHLPHGLEANANPDHLDETSLPPVGAIFEQLPAC